MKFSANHLLSNQILALSTRQREPEIFLFATRRVSKFHFCSKHSVFILKHGAGCMTPHPRQPWVFGRPRCPRLSTHPGSNISMDTRIDLSHVTIFHIRLPAIHNIIESCNEYLIHNRRHDNDLEDTVHTSSRRVPAFETHSSASPNGNPTRDHLFPPISRSTRSETHPPALLPHRDYNQTPTNRLA